ncbi:Holliday junction branch migration protein RuvA [Maricaulis virginensis]|uniref:Holliday junction branch migration complex subunit RuvA n=1 Tax=Maricaulis virginensis TaxID=144022 RepID=A0A9W6IMU3_9PROT|nr:Holliday junction branch migration protein RuvA [Maricaulis virginensis]GLK51945.1 Holliday junction ATP-dependent DNA helicase RuvA [Maricaulis virginensis]
MIGMLKGIVEAVGADEAVIDVNGVGYLVGCASRTLSRLEPGQPVTLHIETHVREDAFRLFGFLEDIERAWFVHLQNIQGVGAKAAFAILDTVPVSEIANAAALGDKSTFARAKGVGPKLATRIATELKDKAPPQGRSFSIGLAPHAPETASGGTAPRKPETPAGGASREDAVSALTNLGYHESLARQAVATVLRDKGEDTPLNDVIRLSLKELAP